MRSQAQLNARWKDGAASSGLHGPSVRVVEYPVGATGDPHACGFPDWQAPTLRELADRVEHQFGDLPALDGIHDLGFARDEPLAPCDIYRVCDLLGLPAVDFGLDI